MQVEPTESLLAALEGRELTGLYVSRAELSADARHHHILDPAGNDQVEVRQISRDVQSESVPRDPFLHVDSDARDLPSPGPNPGEARLAPGVDPKVLERITAAAFSQRRKMLRQSMKAAFPDAGGLLAQAGIEATRRAETLSVSEFLQLTKVAAG